MFCQKCGGKKLLRAHRRTFADKVLGAAHVYPYRCSDCKRRSYSREWDDKWRAKMGRFGLQMALYGTAGILFLAVIGFMMRE